MSVVSDPIADMLTRIRNAVNAKQDSVRMPSSQMKISLAKILREEGFIKYFKVVRAGSVKRNPKAGDKKDAKPLPHNLLIIYLKYGPGGESVINGVERVSRPGLRRSAHQAWRHAQPRSPAPNGRRRNQLQNLGRPSPPRCGPPV